MSSLDSLVMIGLQHSPVAESFRSLRTSLMRSTERGVKHLLFVSAWPGDGKSLVCANTAAAFAQIGKRVILVDVDLRRATLGNLFNQRELAGLSEVLDQQVSVESVLHPTDMPNLMFLPGGQHKANPADLMSGLRMREVLHELESLCDLVVFDSPPLSLFAEGVVLAGMVGGVVIVINPSRWRGEAELDAKRSLEEAGANILGLVLNGVEASEQRGYGGYGGYGYGGYGGYGYGGYGGYGYGSYGYGDYGYDGYGKKPAAKSNGKG